MVVAAVDASIFSALIIGEYFAGIPLLVGNCKDESTLLADVLIARYRADYPEDTPSDLCFRIAADRGARRNALDQAREQSKQATVYVYNFAWNTPLDHGRLRAFHTSELPLAMRLVLNPEGRAVIKANCRAPGQVSHEPAIPIIRNCLDGRAFSEQTGATMIFDVGKTAAVNFPASTGSWVAVAGTIERRGENRH
jgi:carboxylesterase type B